MTEQTTNIATETTPAGAQAQYRFSKNKKTLLLVDDDPIFRKMLKMTLKPENFDICEAGSATECMERLSQHGEIDMVLIDVDMPNMNGITLVSMIRNQETYSRLALIMVTAKSDQKTIIQSIKAGAHDYVLKPIDQKTLVEKIYKHLHLGAYLEPHGEKSPSGELKND
jgi:CheY-like chemotaxis protein